MQQRTVGLVGESTYEGSRQGARCGKVEYGGTVASSR